MVQQIQKVFFIEYDHFLDVSHYYFFSSASHLVFVDGTTQQFCVVENFFLIQLGDDQKLFLALTSFYPQESKTLYWTLLHPLSNQKKLVEILHFEGNFLLFPGDGTCLIAIKI